MKKLAVLLVLTLGVQFAVTAQKKQNLENVVVVGLFDRKDERFQMEILLSELLLENKIKTKVSLNFLKEGADVAALANDSIQQVIKSKGYENFILMYVRGFDKKYNPPTQKFSLEEELKMGHLFPIYREDASSVTFEFKFYKGEELIGTDIVKIPSPSKEGMLKKFRIKMEKRIKKAW